MKNKENKRSKTKEDRNRSVSYERTQKKSNFSSIIFQSGRNSLCSPKDTRPTLDKYNTYMQYISSGKFIPDSFNGRQTNILFRPKASTPTPRRLSVTLLQQGRKSVTMRENPLRDLSRNQKLESPKSKNKSLFVKGTNVVKPKKQKQRKQTVKGNGFQKKKKSSTKVQIKKQQSKEEDKLEQKQKKLIEKLFANIQFHRNLGRGAHALVRSGIDFNNKRKIAVKVYEKQKLTKQETMSIYNQVQVLGSLSHPTIIKLYEIIETFKTINLVMEYGGGNTLQQYIRNRSNGRLDQRQARTIFRAVTSGISYIHEAGVAHRDIKTQNILLNKYLQVKIIDFGFSQKVKKKELSTVFCGTPTYMPPQIITKTPHSPFIADCWSLGILLYNMLHGHCPFKAQNQKQLFQKINNQEIQIEQHIGSQAQDLLNKLLCKTAVNRISSQEILSHAWLKIQ